MHLRHRVPRQNKDSDNRPITRVRWFGGLGGAASGCLIFKNKTNENSGAHTENCARAVCVCSHVYDRAQLGPRVPRGYPPLRTPTCVRMTSAIPALQRALLHGHAGHAAAAAARSRAPLCTEHGRGCGQPACGYECWYSGGNGGADSHPVRVRKQGCASGMGWVLRCLCCY